MKLNKSSKIELSLFIGSFLILLYFIFMSYSYAEHGNDGDLMKIMEFMTIPAILIASIIPIVVVLRFIRKKTRNRTIAILTLFFSLMTAFLLGYTSF